MHHWNESAGAQLALSYQLSWENPAKQAASWPHDRVKVIRLKKKKKCFTTIQLGRWSNQKRTAFIFSNGKNMLMAAHFTRWNSGTQAWEVRYLAACLCYQKTHTTLTTLGITVRALTINQLDSSNIITVQGLVEEPLDKMLQPPLHRSRTGLFPLNE